MAGGEVDRFFSALLRLADLIGTAPERRVLAEAALDAALQPLGLERGGLFLAAADGTGLALEASRGMPPQALRARGRQGDSDAVAGIAGVTAGSRRAVAIEDLSREPAAKELVAGFREAGVEIRSAAAVPILQAGRLLGVILAISEPQRAWAPSEGVYIRLVGALAGAALTSQSAEREVAATNQELQALTRALEQRTAELKELDKYKAQSIHILTHELRKPLSPIFTYSDMMLGIDFPAAKQKEFLRTIRASADEMNHYIAEMIAAANLEQGGVGLLFSDVDVTEVVRFAVAKWGKAAGDAHVQVDLSSELPKRTYTTDGVKIGEIVEILVENAIKYTPAGGHVTVQVGPVRSANLEVAVHDTGIGIPEDELPNLFQKFRIVRGAAAPRPSHRAGIGLYLARVYAESMGGTLSASSSVGKGSTFTLRVPVAG